MITWFARSTGGWWAAAVAEVTRTMDDIESVWEPFLVDDELDAPHAFGGASLQPSS
jgi:hypothetical protein